MLRERYVPWYGVVSFRGMGWYRSGGRELYVPSYKVIESSRKKLPYGSPPLARGDGAASYLFRKRSGKGGVGRWETRYRPMKRSRKPIYKS